MLFKPLGIGLGVFLGGNGVRPAVRAGLSLSQIGEFSFVIAGVGVRSGAVGSSLLAIAVGVCCVTTLTSGALIRRSEQLAGWVAHRMPERLGLFVSFYEAWLGRLRRRDAKTPWRRLRRPVFVLLLDAGVVIAIVIASSTFGLRLAREVGLEGRPARIAIVGLAGLIAVPFVISLVRRVVVIARILALEVIPAGDAGLDLGRAPRRALMVMFELGDRPADRGAAGRDDPAVRRRRARSWS